MNQYSSKEESRSTITEKWRLSRMRRQIHKIKSKATLRNRGTHQETTTTQPTNGNIPQSIVIINVAESRPTKIPLTPIERTAIEAQDVFGWDHFIRGCTSKAFRPAIQIYYNNNKIRSFSAYLRWSNAINKCNFSTHQSA